MNKVKCKLIGEDGNIFNLLGIARREMKRAGQDELAKQMTDEVFKCKSYDEALQTLDKYVDIY